MYITYHNEILKNLLILANIYNIERGEIFQIDNREDTILYNDIKEEIQDRIYHLMKTTDVVNLVDKSIDIDYLPGAMYTHYNIDLEDAVDIFKEQLKDVPEEEYEERRQECINCIYLIQLSYMMLPFCEDAYIDLVQHTEEPTIIELNKLIGFPTKPLSFKEFEELVETSLLKTPAFYHLCKQHYDNRDVGIENLNNIITEYKKLNQIYENSELEDFIIAELQKSKNITNEKRTVNSIKKKIVNKFNLDMNELEEVVESFIYDILYEYLEDYSGDDSDD